MKKNLSLFLLVWLSTVVASTIACADVVANAEDDDVVAEALAGYYEAGEQGNDEAAAKILTEALLKRPDSLILKNKLGRMYVLLDREKEGVEYLLESYKIDPFETAVWIAKAADKLDDKKLMERLIPIFMNYRFDDIRAVDALIVFGKKMGIEEMIYYAGVLEDCDLEYIMRSREARYIIERRPFVFFKKGAAKLVFDKYGLEDKRSEAEQAAYPLE